MESDGFWVGPIRDIGSDGKSAFVPLGFSFRDAVTGACSSVSIEVAVEYDRNWTVARIREAAFAAAKELLQEVVGLTESSGLEGLDRAEEEREAEKAQRLAELNI